MLLRTILASRGSPTGFLALDGEETGGSAGGALTETGVGGFARKPFRPSLVDREDFGRASCPGGTVSLKKSAKSCVWLFAFGLLPCKVVSAMIFFMNR